MGLLIPVHGRSPAGSLGRKLHLGSILSVPRFQHCLKARRFLLSPPLGAGLLKAPSLPELLQGLLAVQFLLEPTDRALDRFALLQFYFSHNLD